MYQVSVQWALFVHFSHPPAGTIKLPGLPFDSRLEAMWSADHRSHLCSLRNGWTVSRPEQKSILAHVHASYTEYTLFCSRIASINVKIQLEGH